MADHQSMPDTPFQYPTVRAFDFAEAQGLPRSPCFSLYLFERGSGTVQVDYGSHDLASPVLLCFSPYQRVAFKPKVRMAGLLLQFHANFFCIETHHHAVGCNGILFNEVYEVPLVLLDQETLADFGRIMTQVHEELQREGMAHLELLTSTLKILLIKAARLKLAQQGADGIDATRRPETLRRLRELIETHYQKLHRPSDYARLLGISQKTLAELVRTHLHKTLSEVIRDRVMQHAKWQLLHTKAPVKQIAYEVGFEDEFYFSRMFKRAYGCAPLVFREQETAWRGGANMSM